MNTLLVLFLLVAMIGALCAIVASRPRGRQLTALGNVGEGFQPSRKTYLADAAIATRYLAVKIGSDANHVALAGVGDIPLGLATDEPPAAEDEVNVALFGVQCECMKGVASAAIAAGDMLVPAANGKLRTLPGAAGTYYIVGRAIKAAPNADDDVEFVPCFPTQRVVA